MDFFVWVLFIILGGAGGAGLASMLIRKRLTREAAQHELKRQQDVEGWQKERLHFSAQLEDLQTKLSAVREEGKNYWQELQDRKKECRELNEQVKVIAQFEEKLVDLEKKKDILVQEKADCRLRVSELEQELALEKEVIKECLIFVQGNHYLPGTVVQNLMAQDKKHKGQE